MFGGVAVAGTSRLPVNFSSALMRLEIPEETLTFLATKAGDLGPAVVSRYVLETDRPPATACKLADCDSTAAVGFETARVFTWVSGDGDDAGCSSPLSAITGDPTDTGLASCTVALFSSSMKESSESKLSSSEYSGVGT